MNKEQDSYEIQQLLEMCRKNLPDTIYIVKNPDRYDIIVEAMNAIIGYVKKVSPDAKIEINQCPITPRAIDLTIETDEIAINDINGFCKALLESSNAVFYPVRRGDKIVMAIVFNDAYKIAIPYKK